MQEFFRWKGIRLKSDCAVVQSDESLLCLHLNFLVRVKATECGDFRFKTLPTHNDEDLRCSHSLQKPFFPLTGIKYSKSDRHNIPQ